MITISKSRLNEIFKNSSFTSKGWEFSDITPVELSKLYTYYRKAVLDGDMPTTCVGGVKLENIGSATSCFEAIPSLKETFIEVVKNLNRIVFPEITSSCRVSTSVLSGKVTASKFKFEIEGETIKPFADTYVCTTLMPYKFNFYLMPNTGVKTAATNFEQIGVIDYIPLATSHTLWKYLKVIGVENNCIKQDIDPTVDIIALKNALYKYIVNPTVKVVEEVCDININAFLGSVRMNSQGKYVKGFNAIVNYFYGKYADPNRRTVQDFVRLFKGENDAETINNFIDIRNVSEDAAIYFYNNFFKEVFR